MPLIYVTVTSPTSVTTISSNALWFNIGSACTGGSTIYTNFANVTPEEMAAYNQVAALTETQQQPPPPPRPPTDAEKRATELLLENLSAEQKETFEKNGWFIVNGGNSGKRYRIRKGTLVANVDALDDLTRLCAHINPHVFPHSDHLLTQKLMLEYAEDEFLARANRHAGMRP